ncbi:MAG: hypothetical protein LAQ69_36980 [Acidobacteriia bacterium]|nr:hypothetical protein [Terriglobia bacterium]
MGGTADGVDLTPEQRSVEIEFRALHFAAGERLQYQYRLEGAGSDWSKPAENHSVLFASLAPGRYRFAVRSVN